MSGSLRFESTSASSEELGNTNNRYSNGLKGNYLGSSLGRSGSFRDSCENRVFGTGLVSQGHGGAITGELPPLSQCLALEPMTIGDRKFNRSGEVKRFIGASYSSGTEENPLGSVHARSPPPVTQEDLKRFKRSVADTSLKARGRTKKLDESLHKLNEYFDAISSLKHQRSELLANEKYGGSALLKNGAQIQRNMPEDRSKNNNMNKRVRTAVVDNRPEGRNNATPRQNLLPVKDRDLFKESSTGSDVLEEKIRKIPSGGEGWDHKMKRKRSAGSVFMRSRVDDTDLKRQVSQKISIDSSPHLCDAQGGRSGSLSGASSMEEGPFSGNVNVSGMPKNEPEKVSFLRDATPGFCKERTVKKGNNNKVNNRGDDHIMSSSSQIKGKGSRAPRTGPVSAANSTSYISRFSGATEGWDQPSNGNKFQSVNGNNIRTRHILSGSPPMAQWVGQRPQKIQRNRRANLVSPVSKHDDLQTSSEDFSPDIGGRTNSSATNLSPQMKAASNGLKAMKVKHEFVSSPGVGYESEEFGADDNKIEDKGKIDAILKGSVFNSSQLMGSSFNPMKKEKLHTKCNNGDGVRRQGRSGRGSQTVRSIASPTNENLENNTKPARNSRPGSDKSGSKSGRPPLKKSLDRNKFTQLGQISNGGSTDCTGDSDDDHEELIAAAEFIRDSSSLMCANSFWKQIERLHASVISGDEDAHYIEQELKSSELVFDNLCQMFICEDNILGNGMHGISSVPPVIVSEEKQRDVTVMPARTADVVDNFENNTISKGKYKDFPSLYQRVLSALIVEDELEEFDEAFEESEGPLYSSRGAFPPSTNQSNGDMNFNYNTITGPEAHQRSTPNDVICNGNYVYDQSVRVHHSLSNGKLAQAGCGAMYNTNESAPELMSTPGMPPFDYSYDQMQLEERLLHELHSIGLYPETVPDLSEDDEVLNEEIYAIKKQLSELVDKKRLHLEKACKAIQKDKEHEARHLEQLAVDRLTEVAYRKLLATRGSNSSKSGPTKISKQITLSFAKRTLARCHTFEASGKSCFGESPFRDILAARPRDTAAGPSQSSPSGLVVPNSGDWHGSTEILADETLARNDPMFNKGKKKEVLLDDVGATTSLRASAALNSQLLGGGAKGKRSERDARNNNSVKNGRSMLGSSKGERQPKPKPKQQKSSQHPTSRFPKGSTHNTGNKSTESTTNRKKTGPTYTNSGTPELKKTNNGQINSSLHDLESIEELGVGTVLGENQDLDSWLNFDDDGLQEHDALDTMDLSCLEIPMDDLNMILR